MGDIFNPAKLATVAQIRVNPEVVQPVNLLEMAQAHTTREGVLTPDNTWFQAVTISSDQQDSHFTYMDPDSTLPNMVRDATKGVSVLDSHVNSRQPFGRSLTGEIVAYEGMSLVASWFYTKRGVMTSTGLRTDDYIELIESGISKELSVGVSRNPNSWVECNICKLNMLSWDCEHWPGQSYVHPVDLNDPEGAQQESVAVGRMIDWDLVEYSFVYKGSNQESNTLRLPEAKARMYASAGAIDQKMVANLERAYDIELGAYTLPTSYALGALPVRGEVTRKEPEKMANATVKIDTTLTPELRETFAPLYGGDVEAVPADLAGLAERFTEILERSETLETRAEVLVTERDEARAEVHALKPLAADGKTYRSDLIEEAIAEGIRALPADDSKPFPKDLVRSMLERSTIDEIKTYRDHNASIADLHAPGGRRSVNPGEGDPYQLEEGTEPETPVEAHVTGRRPGRRR